MALTDEATPSLTDPDDDQKRVLTDVGEEILVALEELAKAAERAFFDAPPGISTSALANPSNMMVGTAEPQRRLQAKNADERASLQNSETNHSLFAATQFDFPSGRLCPPHRGCNDDSQDNFLRCG